MIRINKYLKSSLQIMAVTGYLVLFVASAWATVSFVYPQDENSSHVASNTQETTISSEGVKRARAPEPATIMLFGGGFIGMIASFVRRTYAITKRVLDIVASIMGFIVLSPLFLIAAILVKITSRGPIIYSQTRVGKNGELFNIYKFRTMKVDAEKETGPVWAKANDNRLTPIGGFLRKAHIDEIPQLFNILTGSMSLIGPRPERPMFVDQFKTTIPDYQKRLAVKPGITGLAQVWHRYDENVEDVKKKLKYDLLYIKKLCLWADFSILLRTFRVVVTGEGAR